MKKSTEDYYKETFDIEVSEELSALFSEWDKEAGKNRKRRERQPKTVSYIEGDSEQEMGILYTSLEELIVRRNEAATLHKALEILTDTQRRRLIAHHVDGLTFREIAYKEKVHFTSVQESILSAEQKLKKYLINL